MKNDNPNKVKGVLKLNDTVSWRGAWGNEPAKPAVIESIEVKCNGTKSGTEVDSVEWNEVTRENVVVNLVHGNWAYGNQISEIN
jgi:hypothetical protein